MLSFKDGYAQIQALGQPLGVETIPLDLALGRILRQSVTTSRPHPAIDNSAMDGYALAGEAQNYKIIGEIPAGAAFSKTLKKGEAARIFTGAAIPQGCDRVLIQENASLHGHVVSPSPLPNIGANIRRKGGDFDEGFTLQAPKRLKAQDLALIAAMNQNQITVSKIPQIQILATGNELIMPGAAQSPFHVIASNAFGIKALAQSLGAKAQISPPIKDDKASITRAMNEAKCDILITTGGASVGKFDFVESAAKDAGFEIALHKIALRPGKPIMAGYRGERLFLGLPGNPVSALICAEIFLRAMILKLQGIPNDLPLFQYARLQNDIPANGDRTHFMRAQLTPTSEGILAQAFQNQDSAAISKFAKSNGLLVIEPNEPAKKIGEMVKFIDLN